MRRTSVLVALLQMSMVAFAVVPVGVPIEVAVKIRNDVNAWSLSSDVMPSPSWQKDGVLSILYQAHGNGSFRVVETGARGHLINDELVLCYSRSPINYGPNEPIPAITYPVAIEFRIRGLKPKTYTVKDISVCQ